MTATIALAAALAVSPGQAGGLALTNVRFTYPQLGATRPDARFLPGDVVFISFDIEGLAITPDGGVAYSMSMEVLDKIGKVVLKYPEDRPALKVESVLPLGGS